MPHSPTLNLDTFVGCVRLGTSGSVGGLVGSGIGTLGGF